ncbi:MAG TPA: c-type cytochrome [Gammaproteobacteria bacterium]|nr:c-type cytochrome [Gammaproteobacteria bacterium]
MPKSSRYRRTPLVAAAALLCSASPALAQNRSEASPAALPVPPTASAQDYAPELVAAGRTRFAASCGFCHGPEATGGSGGPDLTRSALVAGDERGNLIGPLVRAGRPEAGMPAFPALAESDLAAIVAFVHDEKTKAESAVGGRRSVEVADLQTGDAGAGRRYFESACTGCHSATGDLKGIASRLEGLALLRRMLYPGGGPPGANAYRPTATVTTRAGEKVAGQVVNRDEFTIAVIDAAGRYRSWRTDRVSFEISDPLEGHVAQLARYTDETMHDVLAYLQTLR